MLRTCLAASWLLIILALPTGATRAAEPGLIRSEFVYESAPFPSCHASTIAPTPGGLVAAWFGGTAEGKPDVGIWVARHDGKAWSSPAEVARGDQDGQRLPCWNPVLHQAEGGPLLLFFKVGAGPRSWWGMLTTSTDDGRTWTPARRLPADLFGPIKNKPVLLADGSLLCPSSTEDAAGWRIHFERTPDLGRTWERTAAIAAPGINAIQPSVLFCPDGTLRALCRTREGRVAATSSRDGGASWTPLTATDLPNPNSGTDAVTLADGRQLLVYNHTAEGRSPLNVAVGSPDGSSWSAALVLASEPGEFSYPAVIQTSDALVHITFTWNRRRIRHIVVDPSRLALRPIVAGRWPAEQ